MDRIVRCHATYGEQLGCCRVASVTSADAVYRMSRGAGVSPRRRPSPCRSSGDLESVRAWLRYA